MFCKSVEGHQYLHSCHPKQVKIHVFYSQALHIKKMCSIRKRFLKHIEELKGWFKAREYPESIINEKVNKFMQK